MHTRRIYITTVAGASIFFTIRGPYRTVELIRIRLDNWRAEFEAVCRWLCDLQPIDEGSSEEEAAV